MGIFNAGTGTGSHPRARRQRLEMLFGLLSVFTLMAAIETLYLEVRGEPAGFSAFVLFVFLVLTVLTWWARSRIQA